MRSFNNQTNFVLFFLVLCLGWQCGGGDGKAGRNDRDASVADSKADGAGQDASPDHISDHDSHLNPDLEPPMYNLNGEWWYSTPNFQGCSTTITQTGNFIFFAEPCPSTDGAKGTISGNKIEFQETDGYKSYTGQILSEVHVEGTWINKWGTTETWYMNKED